MADLEESVVDLEEGDDGDPIQDADAEPDGTEPETDPSVGPETKRRRMS